MVEFISIEDIALAEHEVISGFTFEGDRDSTVWYLAGVHDMASQLMQKIKDKDARRKESVGF